MKKARIGLYLNKLRPVAVLALMRNVVAKMTGNANFPSPAVKLSDITTKADELEAAIEAATYGSRQSKLLRDALLVESGDMLTTQADYVRGVCLGDAAMLDSSGFQLARPNDPLPPPIPPTEVTVQRSIEAHKLKLRWKSVRGARLYYVEMQEEGSTTWERVLSTTRVKHEFTDLTTGKEYSFRVQVVSNHGESAMSEVVSQKAA